jgi:biopolymer transport protein ExbB/TolQ
MSQVRKLVAAGEYERAISLCSSVKEKALPRIVLMGLLRASKSKTPDFKSVQSAIDEGTLEIIPKLQARTNYLAMIGNVSTLIGLMGTIYGLILAFRSVSVPGIDVAEKSTLLAQGISVAMNTTLSGLAIAIPAILFYTIIHRFMTVIYRWKPYTLIRRILTATHNYRFFTVAPVNFSATIFSWATFLTLLC